MSDNIIDSYLVRIGAITDKASFTQATSSMKAVTDAFKGYSTDWLENVLKFQLITTSAFASVGTAAVGLGQHMAELDQNYRLMGLHMMLPTKQARDLQQALDAVGATLQDAIWDPELNQRVFGKGGTLDFSAQSDALLGPQFEENMARIRRFQDAIAKLKMEATSMAGGVVSSLVDKLGLGDYQDYFNDLINSMLKDGPQVVDFLSTRLQPVLEDTKTIFDETGEVAKQFGVTFTNLVGLITHDKSLEGTTFQWQKLGDAVEDVTFDISKLLGYLVLTEKALLHITDASILAASGKGKDAVKELQKGIADFTPATGAIAGSGLGFIAGGIAGTTGGGLPGGIVGSLGGLAGGAAMGDYLGHLKQRYAPSEEMNRDMFGIEQLDHHHEEYMRRREREDIDGLSGNGTKFDHDGLKRLVLAPAAKYSIDPLLIRSVIDVESSGNPNQISDKGAQGLMQLMPGTARKYGVSNPFDPAQNVDGGAHFLSDLLKRYHGDMGSTLAAYNEGPGNVDKGYFNANVLDYINKVEGRYMAYGGNPASVVNNYGDVHVTVNGANASAQDLARQVVAEQKRQSAMASQRAAYQNGGTFSTAR